MGPARVMARRAFVVTGAGDGEIDGGNDGERRGDDDGRQIAAPRHHSDSGRFPFGFERAGKGRFVGTGVE